MRSLGKPSDKLTDKSVENTLKRLDDVMRENFKLKREMVAEKKRYLDLS